MTVFTETLTENTGILGSQTQVVGVTVRDTVQTQESPYQIQAFYQRVMAENARITSSYVEAGRRFFESPTDGVTVADSSDSWIILGPSLRDALRIGDAVSPLVIRNLQIGDRIRLLDITRFGVAVGISDTMVVGWALSLVQACTIIDRLNLSRIVSPAMIVGLSLSDRVRFLDAAHKFFSGDISDTITITPTESAVYRAMVQAAEGLAVHDNLTHALIFRAIMNEAESIDDSTLLQMLYNGTISDGIQLSAAYVRPGEDFTTWAVNTRTGATTEYSNYAFNSFGRSGLSYLGASDTGLYVLNGDDDVGSKIIAQLRSGYAQFNASRFTGFKAAYLGARADGEFVFKIETGTGDVSVYRVVAQDMQTTKIQLGKGFRARYFAFELISDGQDFDLDTVEFVPMLAQRRV